MAAEALWPAGVGSWYEDGCSESCGCGCGSAGAGVAAADCFVVGVFCFFLVSAFFACFGVSAESPPLEKANTAPTARAAITSTASTGIRGERRLFCARTGIGCGAAATTGAAGRLGPRGGIAAVGPVRGA